MKPKTIELPSGASITVLGTLTGEDRQAIARALGIERDTPKLRAIHDQDGQFLGLEVWVGNRTPEELAIGREANLIVHDDADAFVGWRSTEGGSWEPVGDPDWGPPGWPDEEAAPPKDPQGAAESARHEGEDEAAR